MPQEIVITADSTCDLSPDLIEKYNIQLLRLHILLGEKDTVDGIDISPDDIYRFVDQTGELPKTAAASEDEYRRFFEQWTSAGKVVIHLNISSKFSSCYQNACNAASKMDNVFVVDSKNLSTGMGHVVLEAAIRAAEGLRPEQIVREITEITDKVEASFVLDRLDYMHKGGRCSSIVRLGANLLRLKPCIEVKNGAMQVGKKYKGKLKTTLLKYVEDRLKERTDIVKKRIFITHTGCTREIVDAVKAVIRKAQDFEEIIETRAGCTVTSHCGPGTLGVLFIRK